ncbi:hypothetical protein QJQ45_027488 [Haematococcus lacustris]|nr:hypothetical protein QJQ45_027488 [Haematococcus lacustris]
MGVKDGVELEAPERNVRRGGLRGALNWYLAWALPGMGMFSEAYIVFSSGQIGTFQQVLYPTCYATVVDCEYALVKHVASYILICGIMAGMLLWGFLGDYTGRKWGSRCVSAIMLSGCILLTFSPWAGSPYGYFAYFVTAQTWYGFGVGGEYPMASTSAAERSSTTPELRAYRGRQVVLVFSNQGMGNLICSIVILISMAIFGQTGSAKQMTFTGAQSVLALTYGFGAVACVIMVLYRFIYLHESKLFEEVALIESSIPQQGTQSASVLRHHAVSLRQYWPRQLAASVTWICNDFAFYGNKLQQGLFISLLYPTATPFVKQQWTVLNGFIALLGYYAAAWIIDRKWYGRVRMQNVGFLAMFVFYIIIYGQWENMGAHGAPGAGVQAFQALYYLSSFFNQFGPNATTWLVAGEIFPTDIRSSYHGFAACMGKLGAIIASLWISYIADQRKVFLVSALWGIAGWFFTTVWMPDTTGLELEEYDRMQRYLLEGRFKDYRGEAVNPRHLSLWEIYVLGWHKQYDPVADKKAFEVEVQRLSCIPQAMEEMGRLSKLSKDEFVRLSMALKASALRGFLSIECSNTLAANMGPLVPKPNVRRSGIWGALDWYLAWALPGAHNAILRPTIGIRLPKNQASFDAVLGSCLAACGRALICYQALYCAASGQVGTFQQVMYPTCFVDVVDCEYALVKHVASYILICGIMAGMLLWGFLGDYTGRKWGSRCVSAIMLSGCILLTFSPWAGSPYGYFAYFVTAQTCSHGFGCANTCRYGFGVGGEYPMASTLAAERSSTTPELRAYRGRQVVLVFSNQGMGNLICSIVILISMAIFGQTGTVKEMTFTGAQSVLALTYGFGAVACVIMVLYRFIYLHESKLFEEVALIESSIPQQGTQSASVLRRHAVSLRQYWPRQLAASVTWICNDFAFYGNKLQQGLFISLLYPTATPFVKQQWTVLNGFIALLGYYAAAWIIDRKWYGRVRMQNVGFLAMFVFYIIIYGQWENMGAHGAPGAGVQAFQALYYLSSFFNQFGPNATTWLVAGEIFPTDIRSSYHGFAACMGKLGAIIASLWISYIADQRKVFLVSALWGIAGWFFTTVWMPDTTGLELEEYDRMQRYLLEGRFKEYRGEAVNPRHLSLWEIYVLGWHKQYDPVADKKAFEVEVQRLSCIPQAMEEMGRLSKLDKDEFASLSGH